MLFTASHLDRLTGHRHIGQRTACSRIEQLAQLCAYRVRFHVADQLFRSSTSLAANYTAACRGRSTREFISKLGIVVEEADETLFWLNFAIQANLASGSEVAELSKEARELVAIFTSSVKTASRNAKR